MICDSALSSFELRHWILLDSDFHEVNNFDIFSHIQILNLNTKYFSQHLVRSIERLQIRVLSMGGIMLDQYQQI